MSFKCNNIEALLPEYLDGELKKRTRDKLEKHLANCPDCQQKMALQQEWLRHRRSIPSLSGLQAAPDGLNERIMAAIRTDAAAGKVRRFPSARWVKTIPAVAGAAVVVVLLAAFLQIYQIKGRAYSSTTYAAMASTRAAVGLGVDEKTADAASSAQGNTAGKATSASAGWQIYSGNLKNLNTDASLAVQGSTNANTYVTGSSVILDSLDKALALRVLTSSGPPSQTLLLVAWPASEISAQADSLKNAFSAYDKPVTIEIIKTIDLAARLNNLERNLYAKAFEQPPADMSWMFILIGE